MKALVMAGGRGTRLHPYSATLPKPLMPIGNRPLLEIVLKRLHQAGVTDTIIAVNHLRHLIEAFFGDGSAHGMRIAYNVEDRPLGTAGPIGMTIDRLGRNFVVTNGDLLTTLNIANMIKYHEDSGADVTVASYVRELKSEFGILDVDDEMRLVEYREKPVYSHLVSMGIYVMKAEAVRPFVDYDVPLDIPDLLKTMTGAGKTVRCYVEDCFWLDVGRPDDFATAQKLVEDDPTVFDV